MVASASNFCNANNNGNANYNGASNSNANGGVRPLLKGQSRPCAECLSAGNETASIPERVKKRLRRACLRALAIPAQDKIIMTDFTDANRLIGGYHRARKCSGWKESCQKYGLSLLKNVRQLQKELRDGTYEQGQGSVFRLNENGHIRLVKALTVKDTVMQHSLCDNVLVPELSRHLIHDNGASLEGKGISFTRKRFEQHLRWHYRRYGTNGYILKIDFRKYFDNIQHDILSAQARPCIERFLFVVDTLGKILKANEVDISFTDEPDYIDQVFNSLEYQKIDPARLTGQQYMAKSMGIGAPTAQIAGIFLPTPIDTWCKTVRRVHCYDAYMDDRIIVHPDKEYLKGNSSAVSKII